MIISPKGINDIKAHEKLMLKAYMPTVNDRPTIGYGRAHGVKMGDTITEAQAVALLREDLAWVEACVNKYVTVPMTQNQYDALCSFVFNLGEANFRSSSMLKYINANKWREASKSILQWNKQRTPSGLKVLKGLTIRRQHESALMLS